MTTIAEYNKYGEEIEGMMLLHSHPLAVKMLEIEADIPEGAVRPKRDLGYHLSQCQAFTLSRRKGMAIAMLAEDNWCWGAIMAYGLVDQKVAEKFPEISEEVKKIPLIEHGTYAGIVSAPLRSATFPPDIVVIYSNVAQLNNMLHSLSFAGEGKVSTPLYPIASCAMSVVPPLSGEYAITLPDPGELGRALTAEDEIIFTLPREKVALLVGQLKMFRDDMHWGYMDHDFLQVRPDFSRPDFYKRLFRECGLDADDL